MGYIHDRDRILMAAVHTAQEVGLAEVTYRRVGKLLGIADRTVVYYFPTKDDLLRAVLDAVAEKMRTVMADALGEQPRTVDQAFSGMWSCLATTEMDPFFRVYVELVGLAAARRSPYDEFASRTYQQWIDWLEQRMTGPHHDRRAAATAAFAQVDGLLLVRHMNSPTLAASAATFLRSHLGHPQPTE